MENTSEQLIVESVKAFCIAQGFKQVTPKVRVNQNGYPFVTFIKSNNEAENIYFSKKAAETVALDTPVSPAMLMQYQIAVTKNAEGEDRVKLISNSERVELNWE